MKRIAFIINILIFNSLTYAQEIAQWRGENRDGKYNETELLKQWPESGPELLWHFDELGEGHSSAAVTTNMVYTAGTINGNGYLFALDHNGQLQWKVEYGKEWVEDWNGVRSTPLIYQGKIYIISGYGKLNCLDALNGKSIWQTDLFKDYDGRNIQWGITENLLINGDMLYCTPGGITANVIALNKDTGELIWKSKANGELSAYNSPLLIEHSRRKILVTMTANSILGIDASNGKLLWRHSQTNQYSVHANTPLYKDGYLYCVSGYGRGGVMLKLSDEGSSIEETWRDTLLDNQMGGVILLNDRIYGAGHINYKWFCLDWNTGKKLFSSTMIKRGNVIFADEMLYCYGESGEIGLVKPESDRFNLVSKFRVPYGSAQHWAHTVIHNKRLYVRHGNSLMVYNISK